jgi:hypothetical protein
MSRGSGSVRSGIAAIAAVVLLATTAWAQDYTVTTATGKLETRPAGATLQNISSQTIGVPQVVAVQLPFSFPYFAGQVQDITISSGGYILPRSVSSITNTMYVSSSHGQDATSGAFPYTKPIGAGLENADGVVAALWNYLHVNDSFNTAGRTYTWTTGTAPSRHFVISWDSATVSISGATAITVQIHLYEGSGRIVLAYSPTGTYPSSGGPYVCGIDSPIDSRFVAPLSSGANNSGYPGSDFVLDPRVATYTGTVLYDRIVSDANGIGNSVEGSRPLAGCEVELRTDSGARYASTLVAADGTFSMTTIGGPVPPSVGVVAQNAACSVSTSNGGVPTTWVIGSSPFGGGTSLGTRTLGTSADASSDVRAALNVARVCGAVYAFAAPLTTKTVSRLNTLVSPGPSLTTAYTKAGPSTSAWMIIGSNGATNSDVWDDAIVAKNFGRHVLASIAGAPNSNYDARFDAVTDEQNAFAEAFGYYLWAAVSGTSTAIDGTSASTATTYDLETPTITVPRGADVAGCAAGALYDLVDSANEPRDAVDGTLTTDRPFRAAASMSVAPRPTTFIQGWYDAGYDPIGITRAFIANQVLVDDSFEPNDDRTEAPSLGVVGLLRTGLVLTRFNEDWFSVTLPAGASSLMADAKYDQLTTGAAVGVEIRDNGGALLATGTLSAGSGAVHAVTGAVPAGTYRVGVRHLSGGTVPTYDFQVFVPPSMDAVPVTNWTVGQPYDRPLGAADGVAPYTVSASSGALPPGLVFDAPTMRVFGTPSTVGSFQVTVKLTDAGSPANVAQRSESVTIHDVLKIPVAPFVGFPLGTPGDTTLPTSGGTPPFTLAMTNGMLPSGLAFDPDSLHVTGTITAGPSSAFELDGSDVAGSTDHVATRGVVAHPSSGKNVVTDLVAGEDACGWWFDAVEGSKVAFTATTAKKHAKRVLAGLVLAPDRSAVLVGKIKAKTGSLTGSGIVCPASGRYYVIASSADGEATQLLGNVHVAPPKAGKSKIPVFAAADTTTFEVGALPGATLTLKFAGEKKTGLVAKIVSVTDPAGTPVSSAAFIKATAIGGTLTMPLAVGGTWTIVLGATSTSGVPGKFSYNYAIKQPKDGTYSAD